MSAYSFPLCSYHFRVLIVFLLVRIFDRDVQYRFIFATESYGGHYGPSFVTYFDQQNALIASRKLQAEPIVVSALMINKWVMSP